MPMQKSSPIQIVLSILMFWSIFIFDYPLLAEQQTPDNQEDFFEMSIEQLMEVPIVISASRQAQKLGELSVPVSIVSYEDIHYSGATSIPQALQYVPGMDVLCADRNRYLIGVRGLHHSFSDRTLVLINGRNAGNVIFGGADFTRLPVFMEDIERIEVVRGPGGAAWGANAFNGVINIITKKPKDVTGVFGSTTITEFGDIYNQIRIASATGPISWRISSGYDDQESSDQAIDDDNFVSKDFSRNLRFDSEAVYNISESTRMSFGLAYANIERGSYDFAGMGRGKGNEHIKTARLFTRIEKKYNDNTFGYLQWFGNFDSEKRPSLWDACTSENNIEAQLNFKLGQSHKMSVGSNFRYIRINTRRSDPSTQFDFPKEPFDELLAGLFLIDRWQVTKKLVVEGQLRGDWYSETTTDWSARLSALCWLDKQQHHTIRISAAKAFRAPLAILRESEWLAPPPGFGVSLLRAGKLDHEKIYSFEVGYIGRITNAITFQADAYFQHYKDLIGQRVISPLPISKRVFDNIDGGEALGGEIQLRWEGKKGKLLVWYAYNDFQPDQKHQSIRAFGPAKHKTGVTARLFLPAGWTLNANYKYSTLTPLYASSKTIGDIKHYNSLDLVLAKEIADGKGELMFGIADLFDETDLVVKENNGVAHETPGRMFFARIQIKF